MAGCAATLSGSRGHWEGGSAVPPRSPRTTQLSVIGSLRSSMRARFSCSFLMRGSLVWRARGCQGGVRHAWRRRSRRALRHFAEGVSHRIINFAMEADVAMMKAALEEARGAAEAGEVPIGAVLAAKGEIIARSGNRTIRDCDPTAHAEMVVLRAAARAMGNYRLGGTTLYVTLEPCIMCAGALIQARIPLLVYGADDPKGGAARTCFQALAHPALNHQMAFVAGICAEESAALLRRFFAER